MAVVMTEKSCNQFIKEMAAAGFDFDFVATNGENKIKGKCKNGEIKIHREPNKELLLKKLAANRNKP